MKPYLSDSDFTLYNGDAREVLAGLPDASVDAVVTDPPYGLGFMGKEWDSPGGTGDFPMRRTDPTNMVNTGAARQGGRQRSTEDFARRQARDARSYQAWCESWATELLRVLKPGGWLLAFGGTRTYHRLASGIEDAGFEVRDMIEWLYGSGFPKSHNLADEHEGYGTALKPAHEPICVSRKSLVGTVAANANAHGTGALNIEGCRLDASGRPAREAAGERGQTTTFGEFEHRGSRAIGTTDVGRWPANVALDEEAAVQLDQQAGERKAGGSLSGDEPSRPFATCYGEMKGRREWESYGDSGGPSRFFYCAKASRAERNAGLDGLAATKSSDEGYGTIQRPKLDRVAPRENWQPHVTANTHPTVKPLDFTRWLVRLVMPPSGGLILDPFLGSGTTGIAALLEGVSFMGIEREADYLAIAAARLAFWRKHGEDGLRIVAARDAAIRERETRKVAGQLSLIADTASATAPQDEPLTAGQA